MSHQKVAKSPLILPQQDISKTKLPAKDSLVPAPQTMKQVNGELKILQAKEMSSAESTKRHLYRSHILHIRII